MKRILFLLLFLPLLATSQVVPPDATPLENIQITNNIQSTTATRATVSENNGVLNYIPIQQLPITNTPVNYSVSAPQLGAHLTGIDTRLGQISSTTAGITQRVYFTADNTTVTAGTFFTSSLTGKGTAATGSPSALVLADDTKGYFNKDIISVAFPSATIGYAGSYTGQLTVSATPTPNATQQRFTVEIYRTNNGGTPIASGVSGAPTGDLGVTVVAILDSGIINLTAGSITNIPVTGILTQNITLNTGERLRYHVSAAKVGAGGGSVTFGVYYGNAYNSYYDVPVAITTDAVINNSTSTGLTSTDALNSLNTLKENIANKQNSLAVDGTNTKYPTVTAVNAGLATKQATLTNPVTGTGTLNYISKFSSTSNITSSIIYDDGTNVGIGLMPASKLEVAGAIKSTDVGNPTFNWNSLFFDVNNRNWDILSNFGNFGDLDIRVSTAQGNNPSVSVLKIKSTGMFLMGYSSPSGTAKLQVNGTVRISNGIAPDDAATVAQLNAAGRPYKVYTALLTQSGTSAPVATVLENTLGGTVVWAYSSVGKYTATLSGVFTANKTAVILSRGTVACDNGGYRTDVNTVTVETSSLTSVPAPLSDGRLSSSLVEIRVYN